MNSGPFANLPAKGPGPRLTARRLFVRAGCCALAMLFSGFLSFAFSLPYIESDAESPPGLIFGALTYGFLIASLVFLVRAIVRAFAGRGAQARS
jgi:hypothetical protein